MYRPSGHSNRSPYHHSPRQRSRQALKLVIVPAAVLAAVLAGCQPLEQADQMRTDFIALRYTKSAMQALAEPVDAGQASRYATRALELAPHNEIVLDRVGKAYLHVGAYEQALTVVQEAQLMTGRDYYYELGTCYLHTGQQELGAEYLAKHLQWVRFGFAAEAVGEAVYAVELNNVGYTYAEADFNLSEALKLTKQAVRYAPLNPAFTDSLGWVCYKLGDFSNAAFYLERAVRQSRQQPNAELHYHLGVVYARSGQREAAVRELREALDIRPKYSQAMRELRKLNWELAPPWHAMATDLTLVVNSIPTSRGYPCENFPTSS